MFQIDLLQALPQGSGLVDFNIALKASLARCSHSLYTGPHLFQQGKVVHLCPIFPTFFSLIATTSSFPPPSSLSHSFSFILKLVVSFKSIPNNNTSDFEWILVSVCMCVHKCIFKPK